MRIFINLICCVVIAIVFSGLLCLPTQASIEYYQFGFSGMTSLTKDHTQTFTQICDCTTASDVQNIYVLFTIAPRGNCMLKVRVKDSTLHKGRSLLSQDSIDLGALPARSDRPILLPLAINRHLQATDSVEIVIDQGVGDSMGIDLSVGIDLLTK